ncbi:MAG: hypothetical protein QOI12_5234 [Alphaproteobacteria bacterium]|jgi:hypothetical protein|nr:hypothetical protein [Alphaproteobacteria bacterium]
MSKNPENENEGFVFHGDNTFEKLKASALAILAAPLRPGEKPLDDLLPVGQNWLETAAQHLIQIDEIRKDEIIEESAYCIFEVGSAYFQCKAPNYTKHLFCEAVSAKSVPEIGAILSPKKKIRLMREFGFAAPSFSPNFSRKVEIASNDDLAYVARMAFRVLRDIYGVNDFSAAIFKLGMPIPVAPPPPKQTEPTTSNFVVTIDKQLLVLKLDTILSLFGKSRTIEFAEGKWTPLVFFQLEEPENAVAAVHPIDFTNLSHAEMVEALKTIPRDVVDFAGFVRNEIEKIEKSKPAP